MKKKLNYTVDMDCIGIKINSKGVLLYCTGRVIFISSLQTILKLADGAERKFLHEQVFTNSEVDEAIAYHDKLHKEMIKKS